MGDWDAGARGEEGVTAARAGALASPARSPGSRGKDRHTRPPRGVPGFPGAAGLNPSPAAPFRQPVGSAPGRRVSFGGARVVRPGARPRPEESARPPPPSRAYTRPPRSHSPAAPRCTCHSSPRRGGGFGFPEPGPRLGAPSPGLLSLTHEGSPDLGEPWAASACQSEWLMKRAVAAGMEASLWNEDAGSPAVAPQRELSSRNFELWPRGHWQGSGWPLVQQS